MKIDDITFKLSKNLTKFLDFFTDELQRKVLELDSSIESKHYFETLKRVSNSLEQYVKKERSLFYVGFLGSYSSGKSSTINSLLDITSSNKARKVGTNPTDTYITLLTNQSNTSSVFTFAKEGIIPIRTETNFESEFLNNIVLMDTPGSGDPNIIETIVRDSLPLCDLIIYVLNATAPFTEIDRPFLIAQQSKLNEIPILFVITRANEYKLNKKNDTSPENFNSDRYKEDLKVLVTRINEAVSISSFTSEDFTIIDNEDRFNITALIEKIEIFTNGTNENLIKLHNHKLNYFEKEIRTIHNYFLGLSKNKIEKCEKFVLVAKNNIENFDEKIEVSKLRFKKLWNDNSESFGRIYDGTVRSYLNSLKEELDKIYPLGEYRNLILFRFKKQTEFKSVAKSQAHRIVTEMESFAYREVTKLENSIVDLLNEDTLKIDGSLQLENNFIFSYDFPIDKIDYINEFNNLNKESILNEREILKNVIQKISRSLKRKTPLDTVNEDFIKYSENFFEIMNLYYEAIKIYNLAAFSFEVRSYISELGLSKEFDKLESADIDKSKYEAIAREELLIDFKTSSKEFEEKVEIDFRQALNVMSTLDEDIVIFDFLDANLENHSNKKEKDQYTNKEVSTFINEAYHTLSSNLRNNIFKLQKDIKRLKWIRGLRYFVSIIIFPALFFSIKWFLSKNEMKMPIELNFTILINVGCSIVAAIIYSLFDKYKDIRLKTIKDFKKEIIQNNEVKTKELLNDFKEKNIKRETEITDKLIKIWSEEENNLFKELLACPFLKINEKSIEIKKQTNEIINSYRDTYTIFHKKLLSMFENQDSSLDKINSIAAQIKEDSIRPSFDLLKNTISDIKTVKEKIEILN